MKHHSPGLKKKQITLSPMATLLHQSLEIFIIKQKELNSTKMKYKLKAKSYKIAA